MSLRLRILNLLAAASLLAGCGGGGGSHSVPQTTNVLNGPGFTLPQTFSYGQALLKTSSPIGPAKLGTMKVDVMLKLPNVLGLQAYAKAVGDPTSGLYRHFLTPDQIGAQYGASDANYKAAIAYFGSQGLTVTGWKTKMMLRVTGAQAKMERAFGTTFVKYAGHGTTFYGPSSTPHFSKTLAVSSASHLIYGAAFAKRNSIIIPPHGTAPGFDGGYPPQPLAAAFDYNGAYAAGYTGNAINIGIIGTGPIDPADYTAYKATFSTGATNSITQVNVGTAAASQVGALGGFGGSTPAPAPSVTPPCGGSLPSCNPEDGEAQLDTQQTAALAPSASVLFYLAYVPDETCNGQCGDQGPLLGISEVYDEVQQAIDDNSADVISISYGLAEEYSDYNTGDGVTYNPNGIEPVQFAALQAEGIAVFVSSGDAGAEGCARPYLGTAPGVSGPDQPCVSAPAVDQNVTSVGGITTPIDESGRQIGPYTTWGVQTNHGFGATGGGLSVSVPKPSWQTGPGVTGSFRNQPDIALEADSITGVSVALNISFPGAIGNTGFFPFGGTSVAAPEAAAMWALVLDACKKTSACAARGTGPHPYRLGNAAPYFYTIYNSASLYPATFLDIVDGNNGIIPCYANPGDVGPCPTPSPSPGPGFNAGVGYDLTTGIGVPFARHLIKSVVGV